jgi:O-antigen ligase
VLGAAGLLASIGFAVDWLDRRGVSALSVGKFTLASFSLLAAVFCHSVARAAGRGRIYRRLWWLLLAATVLICVLVTGSRTGLVLVIGLLGFGLIKGRVIRLRAVVASALTVVALVAVLVPVAASMVASRAFLQTRIETAAAFVKGEGRTDRSLLARQRDYGLAREALASSPVFGVSPGHLYPPSVSGLAPRRVLDTPLVTPAKFGIAGMALLVVALALLYRSVSALRRLGAGEEPRLAVRVYALVFSVALPFGAFLEDGGFAVAILLLVAACGAEAREGSRVLPSIGPAGGTV